VLLGGLHELDDLKAGPRHQLLLCRPVSGALVLHLGVLEERGCSSAHHPGLQYGSLGRTNRPADARRNGDFGDTVGDSFTLLKGSILAILSVWRRSTEVGGRCSSNQSGPGLTSAKTDSAGQPPVDNSPGAVCEQRPPPDDLFRHSSGVSSLLSEPRGEIASSGPCNGHWPHLNAGERRTPVGRRIRHEDAIPNLLRCD